MKPQGFKKLIFLSAIPVFLFLGSNASAISCRDVSDTQSADFSCDITYTDTGGSGLIECSFKLVGTGYDSGWDSESCSGSSATRNVLINIPDPPLSSTYTIKWQVKDIAGNIDEGDIKTFTFAGCIPPILGNWEIYRHCVLETSGSDLQIKDGATLVRIHYGTNTLTLASDVYIKNGGTLDIKGNSNISFSGSPRYIFVESGGNLYQSDTAGINK